MLSTVKSFETLTKHNKYGLISDSFALIWYSFTPLAYKEKLLPL